MSKQPWALILGASSGFGEAAAIELARAGMNILGVHLDPSEKLVHVADIQQRIRELGREAQFFNVNAAEDAWRRQTMEEITARLAQPPGTLRVLLHSLSRCVLGPLTEGERVVPKKQLETTADIMGHSLVYWVQDCLRAGLLETGARIFAMTSSSSARAMLNCGPLSAAKAILESHIRQLALELAPSGITANAILAGVTYTPSLRVIPGYQTMAEAARQRNPHGRLTTPEDVARTIAALCHPATYWLTGNTLHVDGGENIAE
jgi:enoyl-[acyl-carrier protein] reductase III